MIYGLFLGATYPIKLPKYNITMPRGSIEVIVPEKPFTTIATIIAEPMAKFLLFVVVARRNALLYSSLIIEK